MTKKVFKKATALILAVIITVETILIFFI